MHCHLELHQVEGMTLLLQEGDESRMSDAPPGFPTCGGFDWSAEDFETKLKSKSTYSTDSPVPNEDADIDDDGDDHDLPNTNSAATSLTLKYRRTETFLRNNLIMASEILFYFHIILSVIH